ncbi:uncharacterized protein LOC135494782 [Lineus longissimus]|uniref:uncharacterized protein LOC135494782 n=1 Tax=Lineus longissimus TaxID=88925 RepID=UPI00315CC657
MCYMFFIDKVSQAEAIDACKSKDNSDLLSIQNQDEQDFIDKALSYDYLDHWTLGKKAAYHDVNRALKKPAWQSSTSPKIGLAVNAVDGNFEDTFEYNSCTHTMLEANAWWAVDLANAYSVTGINLQNRGDCCAERLSNFDVVVSNTKPPTSGALPNLAKLVSEGLCMTQLDPLPRGKTSLKCITPKDGSYVYVILKGRGTLTICEAEVFGVRVDFTYAGEEIKYGNWLPNELLTETAHGEEACISLVKDIFIKGFLLMKWKWNTKPCTEKKSFVCQHVAKRCPALPTAQFVEPHPAKPYIELTINFKCALGYEMPNYRLRYKKWKAKKPPSNETTLTKAWQAVRPNITKKPSMRYTCEYPGKWSKGSLAPCEAKRCPSLPEVKHAVTNSSAYVYPAWVGYQCEHGYHYAYDNTSSKVSWCSPDMEWIDVPDDCEPVECELFPRVGNATLNSAKNRYKETVIWTCNQGFMFPDRAVSKWISCRENFVNWQIGRWNISKLDDCIPLVCPDPPQPMNTNMSSYGTAYKTVILYSCVSEEFEFPAGDAEMQTECVDGAQWRPTPSPCREKPKKLKLKGKFYVPPPKESPSAEAVGTLAMIIMIILVIIMVLMDLNSMLQGFRLLRFNLKSRFCHKKQH